MFWCMKHKTENIRSWNEHFSVRISSGPICNWRRALKHSYVSGLVIDKALEKEPKASICFLNFDRENVASQDLKDELRNLTKGFDRLFKRAKVKKNLIGYMVSERLRSLIIQRLRNIILIYISCWWSRVRILRERQLYRAGRMDGSMATINAVILYSCCEC